MVKFTLLELHVEDADFPATATDPFGPGEKEVEAGESAVPSDDDSGAAAAVAALVGLAFLVGLAYVAKRRFLGDDDGVEADLDREIDIEA